MSRGLWFSMNARTRKSLTLLWTALFLFSLILQSVQLATPTAALAAHDENLFELEGDAVDDGSNEPDDDWNSVNHSLDSVFIHEGTDVTYFKGGGSKDVNDVPDWEYSATDVAPDKDEILDAFAAAYEKDGDTFVYFGADRFDGSGDSFIGFWFFQDEIGLGANGQFIGEHVVGDILVVSDFTNGGDISTIKIYEWDGSGLNEVASGVACDVPGEHEACAIVNADTETAPWAFTDKDGGHDFAPGAFYEGGINLDLVFGTNPPCFSSFLAETRSSASTSAQLKDFALGDLNTCVPPVITTQVKNDQGQGDGIVTINSGESVTDTAVVGGSKGPGPGTVDFFVCGPTNSPQDCNSGGTQVGDNIALVGGEAESSVFTPTAKPTTAQPDYYCFRVEYTPSAASQYLAGEHTNNTTECLKVIPADVRIIKTPDAGTVNAGEAINFTLQWGNVGEGKATGVVVTDNLPGNSGLNWSIDSFTGTGSTCAIAGAVGSEVLTCNVGSINGLTPAVPADVADNTKNSGSVTVTSATTPASCAVIDNTGVITSANDGTSQNPGQVTVQCPDVNVVKTPNDGQVSAGDPASFAVVVSNAGPGAAVGLVLNDPLPAGLTWALGTVTGNTDGVSCSVTGPVGSQVLACSDANLMTAGQSFTVTVTTTTTAAQCATYPNVATVDATNESDNPTVTDDNTDAGAITVNCPDVQALKVADASPVNAGDQIGFTVTIKNNGTGIARGATGTDTLPAGITWSIDGPANGWSLVGNSLTFGPADLAPGASASVHIVGTTDAADCGTVPNTVTVDATNESNDPSVTDDNSASASVVVNCPDLQVVKTAEDDAISAGEVAEFSIVITNIGDGTAYDVSLTDTLPGGVVWNLDEVAFDGVPVADPDALCTIVGISLSCPDLGDLAPDGEITITISGDTDLDDCGTLVNSVTVGASNEDQGDLGNNTDSATVVVDCPELAIDKDADHADPVLIGSPIGFTVTIQNNGAGTAFGVTVSDTLDSDFSWSIESSDPGWSLLGNVLSFSGNLTAGASSSVHVTAPTTIGDGDQCGLVPNTAVLDHPSIDPTPAEASETVQCPDIEIIKGADDDLVEPNQTVSYLLDVQVVDGPVTNAVVTDELPVGQTYVPGSAESKVSPAAVFSPDEPTVSPDGRTLTWEFAILVTGDPSLTIMYDVTIDADATSATQVNEAEICISENQLCDSDDEDVTPEFPDIEIIKTAGDAADGDVLSTTAGPVEYTYVVTNDGPLPLVDVTVTDDAGTPGDTSDDFEADCPQTTLAVDESMTCTFTIDVAADTVNVAVAHGVTAGGNPVEDDDDAEVVILEFGLIIVKTNDAPLEPLELPDGTIVDLPTADEGETVTYTLDYDLQGDPVTNGVITDVLPVGVTYVDESATNSAEFIFQGYDDATRTLTWTADDVTVDGSVTYQATVDVGASLLVQPLENVATIVSDQTLPDIARSPIFVPTIPAGATATPKITLPPTDTLATDTPASSSPGFALMLTLLALAAVILVIGFVTPVPASVRERSRR